MPRKMNKKDKDEFRKKLADKKEAIIRVLTDKIIREQGDGFERRPGSRR